MRRICVQDELWIDTLVRNAHNPYSEVLMPTTIGRRTRIEQRCALELIDERNVAVAEECHVHLAAERLFHLVLGGSPTVAMNGAEGVLANRESNSPRQGILQGIFIVIANYGKHRRDVRKVIQHPVGVDIAEMDDEPHSCPFEQGNHLRRHLAGTVRINMGIGDHAKCQRSIEGAALLQGNDCGLLFVHHGEHQAGRRTGQQ